ncbi:hypothetical protein OMP40_37295 [Cohnella rhizosphaerae]|uniref:Alpha-galactosidase n=1 Tax=Cohnella rhizosphaerae TaxID=1457232 RepID=A0A9X4KZX8_9BACL|nr:hypothetical protein [Cohnella rhizosphaerae]MDG0814305.1 hypothetical protein [Cohnella rhizosphaerae]
MNFRWSTSIVMAAVLLVGALAPGAPAARAADNDGPEVSIGQSGDIVTATNGILTIEYDLSTGRGSWSAGATRVMDGFYSDYSVADTVYDTPVRMYSYAAADAAATWSDVGEDGTDPYGTGKTLTLTSTFDNGASMDLRLSLYEGKPFALASMTVRSEDPQTIDVMEPVAADNLDIGEGTDKRIYTAPYNNNTDFGVAPVHDFGFSENGYDRPKDLATTWSPFNGTSYWVAAMFDDGNKHGFIGGAATTFKWKSMQSLGQAAAANGPLTGFSVYNAGGTQSGTTVASDLFFLGYYDDYRDGLEQFGSTYAIGDPKLPWTDGVPMGYNTYYTFYGMPTDASMHAMVDYFAEHLKPLGYTYMNLDCCFKGPSGTGTSADFKDYADYVHGKGMKAGGYEVPFAIWWDLSETVPAAPEYTYGDIALKDEDGVPIKTYLDTYIVDATHPGGQAFIRNMMAYYFVNTGFDYVKLDFLDFGMFEGKHYDPSMNGIQAYRLGMQVARDALLSADRPIFINESIAPLLPSGYAHGRRSGIDTTIPLQNNLYSGIERQALNAAASWWTNGTLYEYNDPDMAIPENIANGFDKYTLNESRLKATIDFLGGGRASDPGRQYALRIGGPARSVPESGADRHRGPGQGGQAGIDDEHYEQAGALASRHLLDGPRRRQARRHVELEPERIGRAYGDVRGHRTEPCGVLYRHGAVQRHESGHAHGRLYPAAGGGRIRHSAHLARRLRAADAAGKPGARQAGRRFFRIRLVLVCGMEREGRGRVDPLERGERSGERPVAGDRP